MSNDKKDPPIIEQEFLGGVKVVDIGDYRVSRGFSRRAYTSCSHKQMVYDLQERRVWCKDCESNIDSFDAFESIVKHFDFQNKFIKRERQEIEAAKAHSLISIASKILDKAWRRKKTAPCCPHCKKGLLPEDFKDGVVYSVGTEFELARRNKER